MGSFGADGRACARAWGAAAGEGDRQPAHSSAHPHPQRTLHDPRSRRKASRQEPPAHPVTQLEGPGFEQAVAWAICTPTPAGSTGYLPVHTTAYSLGSAAAPPAAPAPAPLRWRPRPMGVDGNAHARARASLVAPVNAPPGSLVLPLARDGLGSGSGSGSAGSGDAAAAAAAASPPPVYIVISGGGDGAPPRSPPRQRRPCDVAFYNGVADRCLVVTLAVSTDAVRRYGLDLPRAGGSVEYDRDDHADPSAMPPLPSGDIIDVALRAAAGGRVGAAAAQQLQPPRPATALLRLRVYPGETKTLYSFRRVRGAGGGGAPAAPAADARGRGLHGAYAHAWADRSSCSRATGPQEQRGLLDMVPLVPDVSLVGLPSEYLKEESARLRTLYATEQRRAEEIIRARLGGGGGRGRDGAPALAQQGDAQQAALDACAAAGWPFVDLWFTPPEAGVAFYHLWLRPTHFVHAAALTAAPTSAAGALVRHAPPLPLCADPSPTTLARGPLGAAEFICALACLAEYPQGTVTADFLEQAFAGHDEQCGHAGAVRVHLTINGWWREVLVDTYLPVARARPGHAAWLPQGCRETRSPADAWAGYLEKAYAKAVGGYDFVRGRGAAAVLGDITGCPTEVLPLPSAGGGATTPRFTELLELYHTGAGLVLATRGVDAGRAGEVEGEDHHRDPTEYDQHGLLPGHAYAVLQVLHEDGHELVHLRNPWARGVPWRGALRWDRGVWTPHLRDACGVPDGTDTTGTIMATWREVRELFACAIALHGATADTGELRVAVPFTPDPTVAVELHLSTPARVYLSLYRTDATPDTDTLRISVFSPTATPGMYTYAEDREGEGVPPAAAAVDDAAGLSSSSCPRWLFTAFDAVPNADPVYILPSVCRRGGQTPSELVLYIAYTPPAAMPRAPPPVPVAGDVLLRDSKPFVKAVAMGCEGALVNLSGLDVPLVSAWTQCRPHRGETSPVVAQHVNHVVL